MWATATHRVGALLVGVALVYATVAQGAFAADQALVVFGLVVLAAVVAVVGRRRVPRPVAVAVGLLVALAAWTAARAAVHAASTTSRPTATATERGIRRRPTAATAAARTTSPKTTTAWSAANAPCATVA